MQKTVHQPSKLRVAGSSPAAPTKQKDLTEPIPTPADSDTQPAFFSVLVPSISPEAA